MSFDLDKMQAIAEMGEVIRLHNDALEKLAAFRKSHPHLIMPNLAKMVEENLKDNTQVLYKELNNLHRPAEQQVRYICKECNMAFLVRLPGGVCDECRARLATKPRDYTVHATPIDLNDPGLDADTVEAADEPTLDGESTHEKPLSSEVADAVADDLSVAEEAPAEDSTPEIDAAPDENAYTISMDDDDTLENLSDKEADTISDSGEDDEKNR